VRGAIGALDGCAADAADAGKGGGGKETVAGGVRGRFLPAPFPLPSADAKGDGKCALSLPLSTVRGGGEDEGRERERANVREPCALSFSVSWKGLLAFSPWWLPSRSP